MNLLRRTLSHHSQSRFDRFVSLAVIHRGSLPRIQEGHISLYTSGRTNPDIRFRLCSSFRVFQARESGVVLREAYRTLRGRDRPIYRLVPKTGLTFSTFNTS